MRLIPVNAQYLGTRKEQQDDFGFSNDLDQDFVAHGGVLAIVTDGMGGLARGREASRLAKQAMLQAYEAKTPEESLPAALERALAAANAAVYEFALENSQEGEIGTTLVAGVIHEGRLYWVSAGDSRIYLFRQGRLRQLSRDHDYAQELEREVAKGEITAEEAQSHPLRRALTSYLGLEVLPEVSRNERALLLKEGDRILLCSDGLYNGLGENEMGEFLSGEPQEAAAAMIAAIEAKDPSSQDNVTVAMLACDWDGEDRPRRSRVRYLWLTLAGLLALMVLGSSVYLGRPYLQRVGLFASAPTSEVPTAAAELPPGSLGSGGDNRPAPKPSHPADKDHPGKRVPQK